jgi:hypothetical protein
VVVLAAAAGSFTALPTANALTPLPLLPATQFAVSAPATAVAGTPVAVTVTAQDITATTVTSYTGTVHITTSDGAATPPPDATLTSGVGTFQVTFATAGVQTVTATDAGNPLITGTSGNVTVTLPANHFLVDAPTSAAAGNQYDVGVTAKDSNNATVTGYTGTVHLTGGGTGAALPANAALTSGTGTFHVTSYRAGSQPVTATDTVTPSITGEDSVTITPLAADHFDVVHPAGLVTAGSPALFQITAYDTYANVATGYSGTVHITTSDAQAETPAVDPTLSGGAGYFDVTPKTSGSQTVTATDTTTPALTGSTIIDVTPAAATTLVVNAPATAAPGVPANVAVTATDAYGNTDTSYAGTVHITSGDAAANLPANGTLPSGKGTFSVTFNTVGSESVTGTDTVTPSITGTDNVTVAKGATTTVAGSTPTTLVAHVTSTVDGTPGGTVSFKVDDVAVGSPATVNGSGNATLTHALPAGDHTVGATYSGDGSFLTSHDQSTVTAPTLSGSRSSAHPISSFGWYRSPVTISFTCHQGSAPIACPHPVRLGHQGKGQTVKRTAWAIDGGHNSTTVKTNIDTVAPSVRVKGVQPGHLYSHAPAAKCKARDALSGVASCTIATHQHGRAVTVIATAQDKAGNVSRLKADYKVKKGVTV